MGRAKSLNLDPLMAAVAVRVMPRQLALGCPLITAGSSRPEMESWRSSEEGEGEEEHSEVLIREGKGKVIIVFLKVALAFCCCLTKFPILPDVDRASARGAITTTPILGCTPCLLLKKIF